MSENATNQSDPAQAFEAVRRELSLLHSAIAGLAAEREKIPDYSETLGRMAHTLVDTNKRLTAIEQSRAISLSPLELVKEIGTAAETARVEDRRMLDAARGALDQSLGRIDGMIRRGQAAGRQVERERWHVAAGLLAGILIWAVLPGAIARSLPTSWHVPQWMAARTMGVLQSEAAQRSIALETLGVSPAARMPLSDPHRTMEHLSQGRHTTYPRTPISMQAEK